MPEPDLQLPKIDSSLASDEILELENLTLKSRFRSERVWFLYVLWAVAALAALLAITIPVLRRFERIDQRLRDANTTSEALRSNVAQLQGKLVTANEDLRKLAETDAAKLQAQANLLSTQFNVLKQNKANASDVEQRFNQLSTAIAGKANMRDVEQRVNQLSTTISGKANANEVEQKFNQLNGTVAGKASGSEVEQRFNQLNGSIAGKANSAELEQRINQLSGTISSKANTSEIEQTVSQLHGTISNKANTSYVDSRIEQLRFELRGELERKQDRSATSSPAQ